MELDTEKLLPALQRHLEKHNDSRAAHRSQEAHAKEGPAAPEQKKQSASKSYVEGEWSFKMYVDVLHVQSVLPTDDVVNAARAELLERRSSLPAQAGAQVKTASGVADVPLAADEELVVSNKMAHTPEAAADVKQLLAQVAARAASSPKESGKESKDKDTSKDRDAPPEDAAQAGPRLRRQGASFGSLEGEHPQGDEDDFRRRDPDVETAASATRRLAQGYTVVKSSERERKAVKSPPFTSPKLRAMRNERRALAPALSLNPAEGAQHEAGDDDASDEDVRAACTHTARSLGPV